MATNCSATALANWETKEYKGHSKNKKKVDHIKNLGKIEKICKIGKIGVKKDLMGKIGKVE